MGPRVTALIVSLDSKGGVNAAPYSFVFPISFEPALLGVGFGRGKHSLENILQTKEFTVNIVSEDFGERAVGCEEKMLHREERLEKNGLHLAGSERVKVPHIKEAKMFFECVLQELFTPKNSDHSIVVGRIVNAEAAEVENALPVLDSVKPLMHFSGKEFRAVGKRILIERRK